MTRRATNESPGYLAACKVAEPLRIPRVGAKVVRGAIGKPLLIRQPVCCDFAGTLRDGTGRSFLCDFKRTNEKYRYPTGNPTKLAPHQRDELIRHGLRNAVSGLLIESSATDRQYWCSWTKLHHEPVSVAFDDMIDLGPANVVADLRQVTNSGKDER